MRTRRSWEIPWGCTRGGLSRSRKRVKLNRQPNSPASFVFEFESGRQQSPNRMQASALDAARRSEYLERRSGRARPSRDPAAVRTACRDAARALEHVSTRSSCPGRPGERLASPRLRAMTIGEEHRGRQGRTWRRASSGKPRSPPIPTISIPAASVGRRPEPSCPTGSPRRGAEVVI